MSSSETPNASGLAPSHSRTLPVRSPTSHESSVLLPSLAALYSCSPKTSSYDMYASTAVFHDPVGYAEGVHSIKAQFNALASLFERAVVDKMEVLQAPPEVKEKVLVNQDISYYRKKADDKPFKTLNSLLTLTVDGQGKVHRHVEEWNHSPVRGEAEGGGEAGGFLEMLSLGRKKFTAALTEKMADQTPPSERKSE